MTNARLNQCKKSQCVNRFIPTTSYTAEIQLRYELVALFASHNNNFLAPSIFRESI